MYNEEYNIEIKSEEYNEIVGSIPPVIIRYGIGVLFAVIVFMMVLSNNVSYKTHVEATVFIEKTDIKTSLFEIKFIIKPENIALVKREQKADISLLQYPAYQFGSLEVILRPQKMKFIKIGDKPYYEWTQTHSDLISDKNMTLDYIEGLQGIAKIVVGEETIASKITQSVRSSIGINF